MANKKSPLGLSWPPISVEDMISAGGLFVKEDAEDGLEVRRLDEQFKLGKCSRCGKRRKVVEVANVGGGKIEKFCKPCGDKLFNPGGEGL